MTHKEEANQALTELVDTLESSVPMILRDTEEWRDLIEKHQDLLPDMDYDTRMAIACIPERLRQLEGLCASAEEHLENGRELGIIKTHAMQKALQKVRKYRNSVREEFKRAKMILPIGGTA
jgi:hypothetical protein